MPANDTGQHTPTILIVDDMERVAQALARMLASQGYQCAVALNATAALEHVAKGDVDLALVDYDLPDIMGPELIGMLRQQVPDTAIIAITGMGDADVAFRMLSQGASDYFPKPIEDWQRFFQVIRKAMELKTAREALRDLRSRHQKLLEVHQGTAFSQLIGQSTEMMTLKDDIEQAAKFDVTVLVRGESGSGKGMVARAIHAASRRPRSPFVVVPLGAFPDNMVESELFGYCRGAFTGAVSDKPGMFELAESGTIFLDEIGEFPLHLQPKLLQVLQDKEFRRVGGGRKTIPLKARIIAATHRDLRQMVSEGEFREDLYFRLNVFEVEVPPLRRRVEDLELLTWHFIDKYAKKFGKRIEKIEPEAHDRIRAYTWHQNNVRELENAIERAMVMHRDRDGTTLCSHNLALTGVPLPGAEPAAAQASGGLKMDDLHALPYTEAKSAMEQRFGKAYLTAKLVEAGFNQTHAAELAGMQRPNLARLIKRLGIDVGALKAQHIKA